MMQFRLVGFLLGASLALIPVIIHLVYQRRGPRVYFSTLRFLKLCVRRTARRRRIENLLLLIFRMVLFGLLAVALAEPFVPSRLTGPGPADSVIILDNSYSMAVREMGTERFTVAKEMSRNLLKSAGRVALIVPAGPESAETPVLTDATNEVASRLNNAQIFAGHADITAALLKAYELLADSSAVNRQIVVLSDLQGNSFPTAADILPADHFPRIPVIVYDCGSPAMRNAALTGLVAEGGLAAAGSSLQLVAEVANSGSEALSNVPVTVYVDNRPVRDTTLSLVRGQREKVRFTVPVAQGSVRTGWVQLGPDSLEADNRINFRIGVPDHIDVLLVRDEVPVIGYLDEAYFLDRALAPRVKNEPSASMVRPQVIRTAELPAEDLSRFSAVYLLNVAGLDAQSVGALRKYVGAGGNLCLFPGDRVTAESYADLVSPDRPEALLHAQLRESVGDASTRQSSWKVFPADFDYPLMARFKTLGPPLFERVTVYRFWPLELRAGGSGHVLANLVPDRKAEGTYPFLVSADYGKGSVLYFAVPATTAWSDLPAAKIFTPLMHELLYKLAGRLTRLDSFQAGQPVRLDFSPSTEPVTVSVELPGGRIKRFASAPSGQGNFLLLGNAGALPAAQKTEPFPEIYAPGIYPYTLSGGKSGSDAFVVNPDPVESDLARTGRTDLAAHFHNKQFYLVASQAELERTLAGIDRGTPLTAALFLIVIAVAVVELFVANRTQPADASGSDVKPFISNAPRQSA